MNNPIWLYWETIKNKPEPAYITLCKWCFLHQWSDANIIFLNKTNIDAYLPGISKLVEKIEVDVTGRLDKLKRKLIPQKLNEAVKCDVYRAFILKNYGGIYLDISAIPMNPIKPFFNLLDSHDFFVTQRQSHQKEHYPVAFYGCTKNSLIINEYCAQIIARLKLNNNLHYNELGHFTLTPIVNKYKKTAQVLPEKTIMPITFEEAKKALVSSTLTLTEYDLVNILCFKLSNQPFKTVLKNFVLEDLYYSPLFIGKLFRHSLPETVFKARMNQLKGNFNE